jgi:hypothetical protein
MRVNLVAGAYSPRWPLPTQPGKLGSHASARFVGAAIGPGRPVGGHHVRAEIGGRHRAVAVTGRDPGPLGGVRAPEQGLRYPADPPTVEEIILVMREAGPGPYADRTRGLIAIL